MQKYWKHMAMVAVSFALLGCGGTTTPVDTRQQALEKISQYADTDGKSAKPTLEDYQAAGIKGIDSKNIDTMNDYITHLDGKDVDEVSEIQDAVDHLDEVAADDDGDGVPNGEEHSNGGSDSGSDTPDAEDDSPNRAPTVKALRITAEANDPTPVVLSGEDPDGDVLTYIVKEAPAHGTFSHNTYTPANDYVGPDTFTYVATDGKATSEPATVTIQIDPNIKVTDAIQVESLGRKKTIHQIIDAGDTPKTLYVLLSNYDAEDAASAEIKSSAKRVYGLGASKKSANSPQKRPYTAIRRTPDTVRAFNAHARDLFRRNSAKRLAKTMTVVPRQAKSVGDTETFYLEDESTENNVSATLKKVVANVSTQYGKKTLNVWVADNAFAGDACDRDKCVTQDMVDTLAEKFLQEGEDNDIYDWVTNIYGEEWGETGISNLIGDNDEITILLLDIDDDNNPGGGTIGYFYSKDNFDKATAAGSNERVMFYADSVMFANEEGEGFWQREMYSTLAHEFQHMIHFYQKTVKYNVRTDAWINEMLSEATEYLISTKIGHTTPRGVDPDDGSAGEPGITLGRYNNEFNAYINDISLTDWGVRPRSDYGKVSAFGAYLVNNYGGAKVLHDILANDLAEEDALEKATGKDFDDLLRDWGASILLSDRIDTQSPYVYNTGDFTEKVYGESTYKMGSISFFNYETALDIRTEAKTVQPQGNYYYKIGDNLTGKVIVDIDLSNDNTEATLIAK